MQNPETGKFTIPRDGKKDISVKFKIQIKNQNIHMYQEIIKIQVFKVNETSTAETFATDDKTFIGQVHVMWKECPNKEGENGASHIMDFTLEMVDPEQMASLNDISGKLAGNLKWLKYGAEGSSYNAEGGKLKEK